MATPNHTPPSILPELPLGLAAACAAFAAVTSIAEIDDRLYLAAFFLTAAAVSLVVSIVMARRQADTANHA